MNIEPFLRQLSLKRCGTARSAGEVRHGGGGGGGGGGGDGRSPKNRLFQVFFSAPDQNLEIPSLPLMRALMRRGHDGRHHCPRALGDNLSANLIWVLKRNH